MVDAVQLGQRIPAQHLRFPQRPGHQADDLQMLDDIQADKENEIKRDIQTKVAQHSQWNRGYHDLTRFPLTPTSPKGFPLEFRPAAVAYLPTPPASASSEQSNEALLDVASPSHREREPVRYSSPCEDTGKPPSFRRRLGRNNRLWIDRRMPSEKADMTGIDPDVLDRFKYDHDDDDDEELEVEIDSFDPFHMRYRAHLFDRSREAAAAQAQAARRVQSEAAGQSNALVPATHS
jgi:enhancer of polycomb-like protein